MAYYKQPDSKGAVVIPKALRDQLGITQNVLLRLSEVNGKIVIEKVSVQK